MALTDILAARAASTRATASVDCGALGSVTVEALTLREMERFSPDADGDRGIFFAACRELQQAGNQLMQAGKLVRPDGIMAFVSAEEAAQAAHAVRKLSGVSGTVSPARNRMPATANQDTDGETNQDTDGETGEMSGVSGEPSEEVAAVDGGKAAEMSEVRLVAVQENSTGEQDAEPDTVPEELSESEEIRLVTVRSVETEPAQVRPETVQTREADGQVSRESFGQGQEEDAKFVEIEKTAEILPSPAPKAQDMDLDNPAAPQTEPPNNVLQERDESEAPHETESEKRGETHEIESESPEREAGILHETMSETAEGVHETESEQAADPVDSLHEVMSEFGAAAHEITSEQQGDLHETTSEFQGIVHETESERREDTEISLHEIESEPAERIARQLLEGLRQAAWVR